jgi:isopenicillin N synthase-like dioxygenase
VTLASYIPLIDLIEWFSDNEARRKHVSDAVDVALQESGFLLISGHGIEPHVAGELREAAGRFFALPEKTKARYATDLSGRGWVPYGAEANGRAAGQAAPPDLKETFSFGVEHSTSERSTFLVAPNRWPDEVQTLQAAALAWQMAVGQLALDLTQLLASALGLDRTWFEASVAEPHWNVHLNWYPSRTQLPNIDEGQLRVGPHTDFGTVTILDREPGIGGLQVQRRDGTWTDAPFVEDTLIVNLGDLMARWTGQRWRAAPHRVLAPPLADADEELLSLVYFWGFSLDTVIDELPSGAMGPTRYKPTTVAAYTLGRIQAVNVG